MRWSAEHPGGHAGVRFVPMAVRLDKYLSSNHPDIAIAAALLFLAGLEIDLQQLARFDRALAGSQPQHFDMGQARTGAAT